MYYSSLKTKTIESARKVHSLLSDIQSQTALDSQQQKVLLQDLRVVEEMLSSLAEAVSIDDWRSIWATFLEAKRNFGGYMDNELGQKLAGLMETLLQDILESYTEANKRKHR